MNESHNNKGKFLVSATLLKLIYGKKTGVKKQLQSGVINNDVANNFLESKGRKESKKNKNEVKIANSSTDSMTVNVVSAKCKYWFNSQWKGGIRIIGKTAYNYRSSWEANYARYLQMLLEKGVIAKWEHEPEIFNFPKVKRGLKAYLPDFKITYIDGGVEFHEVKGFTDAKAKTKLKRFAKYYPHIKLKIIDKNWFDQIKKNGIKITGWEN